MARCVEVVTQSAQLPHAILAVDEFRFCCGATEDIDRFGDIVMRVRARVSLLGL